MTKKHNAGHYTGVKYVLARRPNTTSLEARDNVSRRQLGDDALTGQDLSCKNLKTEAKRRNRKI